ncbi:hypothetical protein ACFLZA_00985 [Candidatus Neomarinimicrobiota bacterium]
MSIPNTDWAWPWWTIMVTINIVNLIICALVFRKSTLPIGGVESSYRKRMRIMGLIFTVVGAYRAVFVSRYLSQMAWFDSILNSSLLIRIFAIAAELSFSGLIAFALLQVNKDLPAKDNLKSNKIVSFFTKRSPYFLIGCIFIAQFFATSGLIMKSNTLFAIEETLWSLGFLAVLPLAIIQVRRVYSLKDKEVIKSLKMLRQSSVLIVAWCVIYCSYGLFYHLPLESWPSAINQIETGLPAIKTGLSSIVNAFTIVNESKVYSDWGFGFLFWHSAYFSVCVWISIFLMRAPRIKSKM